MIRPRCTPRDGGIRTPRSRRRPTGLGAALLLLLSLVFPLDLAAQSRTSSALSGIVIDRDGSAVAGAEVAIVHEPTGFRKRTLSREDGRFLILALPVGGPFTLTVGGLGYAPERLEGLQLQVGETRDVTITLGPEAIAVEGVEVTVDRADIFDAEQIGPLTRLSERVVTSLPLPTRDVMEMAVLSPVVTSTASGGFSVGGQNDRYNAVLVDGLVAKDAFGLSSAGVPGGQAGARLIPLDAVAQYEVMVAPYDVRLTGFAGGLLNAVTRSGTNEWRVRTSAALRHESLTGDLSLRTGSVEASGTDQSLLALSVGGPLVRDRAHLFVAAEFESRRSPPPGFNLGRDTPELSRLSLAQVAEVGRLLEEAYGIEPGEAGAYPLERGAGNLFGRLDWNLQDAGRLTLRHILGYGRIDDAPNRSPFDAYEFSSASARRRSLSNLTALQYFADFGDRATNELTLTFQRAGDRSEPLSRAPQVEVDVASVFGDRLFQRRVRAGGSFLDQSNDLRQTSISLINSVDFKLDGIDVLTLGVTGSWFGIRNEFLPGSNGEYRFASVEELRANRPERYRRTVLPEGVNEAVDFEVAEFGVFMQRSMHLTGGLTMHAGMRVDMPVLLGRPENNYDLQAWFGYRTSVMPTGNLIYSPRLGFNWQSEGERMTQVRMGTGLFSGQIPYIWLSNAFQYTGLRATESVCLGRAGEGLPAAAPPLRTDGFPSSCVGADGESVPMTRLNNAVVFDHKFTYPQVLKTSIDFDHELANGMVVSLGFLFNKSFNQVGIQELNKIFVNSPGPRQQLIRLTGRDRPYYVRDTEDFGSVLLIRNAGEDWAGSISAELTGTVREDVEFRLGYSWARSRDRNSLSHTDMFSNYGLNPKEGNIDIPTLTRSDFDRTHKFVVMAFGTPFDALPNTEFSLLYTGQSGRPFSYVYGGDVNGDGYPGPGGASEWNNDLLHVPDFSTDLPLTPETLDRLRATVEGNDCLRRQQGKIARRNSCRAPFQHTLDARVTHGVQVRGAVVEFDLDVFNLLNLIHGGWGRVETAHPLIPLLRPCESGCENERFGLPFVWGGGVEPVDGGGLTSVVPPWSAETPASQWQLQLGVRVTLGGGA